MTRGYLAALICLLCVMLGACSDDGGDDTGSNHDVGSDIGSDVGDFDADAEENDVQEADAGDSDVTEGDAKVAIGEACPTKCGGAVNGRPEFRRCEGCANGYCYFPYGVETAYCTQPCDAQSECNAVGDGLTCGDGVFDLCIPE